MEDLTKPASSQKLPKHERLNSKKIIEELFQKGSSAFLYPFRIHYLPASQTEPVSYPQVLFSVSKRNFKRAVDRNLLKRRMKEAYRKNKSTLMTAQPEGQRLAYIAIVYIAKEKISFEIIEKKLIVAWRRLVNNQNSV
ncbi:ribonuclease P protein component [Rhodocytophaga rosea]|uniref:Ribonuclease P protein component n=1 Tax=Rhodocytophaga rosea TaxID=2704465 RepID=A0A6C0GKH1_9BACT|nr:ribonuclease P protein component [Rhodocytophaga rosea]QHT68536.1 ribonuclease P protein component [Rhodocytophaga rosea]